MPLKQSGNKQYHRSYELYKATDGYCESKQLVPAKVDTAQDFENIRDLLGSPCPHNRKAWEFGDKFYFPLDADANFFDAISACQSQGSVLANLGSVEDMLNILKVIRE